jgi:RNA polymerase sigma-32 factor
MARLWRAHHDLVASVANRNRRAGMDTADLIGAGHLGLHQAIVRFDPDRFPGRLSTYAVPWIRWYVQDHIDRNSGPLRLPTSTGHRQLARSGSRLFDDARRTCQRDGVPTTDTELCARVGRRIGLSGEEVARCRHMIEHPPVSLDTLQTDTLDIAAADPTPEDATIDRLDGVKLRGRIMALVESILGERERVVFLARCMTGDNPVVQLDALAVRFGVSRERIYQLEASARRKIVAALHHEGFTGGLAGTPEASSASGRTAARVMNG